MQLTRSIGVPMKIAFASATIWIVFPSSLQWVAQIGKDGYFFVGMLGALLGWTMLIGTIRDRPNFPPVPFIGGLLIAGIACAGIARQYAFQMLLPIAITASGLIIPLAIRKAKLGSMPIDKAIATVGLLLLIPFTLVIAPRDWYDRMKSPPVSLSEPATAELNKTDIAVRRPWRSNTAIPAFIDSGFDRLANGRYGYLSETYKSAGSSIDLNVQFFSAGDVLAYLPRALQIGFLTPFPSQWFGTAQALVAQQCV